MVSGYGAFRRGSRAVVLPQVVREFLGEGPGVGKNHGRAMAVDEVAQQPHEAAVAQPAMGRFACPDQA